jgi:hypothetical protein
MLAIRFLLRDTSAHILVNIVRNELSGLVSLVKFDPLDSLGLFSLRILPPREPIGNTLAFFLARFVAKRPYWQRFGLFSRAFVAKTPHWRYFSHFHALFCRQSLIQICIKKHPKVKSPLGIFHYLFNS